MMDMKHIGIYEMAKTRRPRRRGGRPRGRAEEKYIGIRTLFSPTNFDSFINDERYDQTLKMALRKEFGENKAETMATMKLGGVMETFKKNLKFIILLFLLITIAFIMTKFPQIISVIPAIFIILYRWRFLIQILSKVFLMKRNFKKSPNKINKNMALEILGLTETASKEDIIKKYQDLMKKNHPDKGGSEWITKKLNQARETLLS